jgi:hypothetical protein
MQYVMLANTRLLKPIVKLHFQFLLPDFRSFDPRYRFHRPFHPNQRSPNARPIFTFLAFPLLLNCAVEWSPYPLHRE